MQNVGANVSRGISVCIFSCILTLLTILIKPLTTKAYDRRASGDWHLWWSLVFSFLFIHQMDIFIFSGGQLVWHSQHFLSDIHKKCPIVRQVRWISTALKESQLCTWSHDFQMEHMLIMIRRVEFHSVVAEESKMSRPISPGSHLGFSIDLKKGTLVEDIEILLLVKFP